MGRSILRGAEEVAAFFRGETTLEARLATATKRVDVQALRDKLKLSQAEFAHRFHFNRRTLQDWEQGRATPDSAVQAYLQVIERAPEVVAQALAR